MRLLFTLCIRVSRKFYLHLCFKLRYYIQNGAKFLQKLTPGFKNHMRNLDNFRQAMESPKSGNSMGYVLLSKKYILSAKTLYTEDLSNITFNYLCENSPNSSCHFSSKKSVFLLKFGSFSSVMRDNCSVLFWLKLYIDKSSTIAKFLMFLPNSSCHFWNQDSVFLQTLHHSSVS